MSKPKPIVDLKRDALGHYRPGNPPGPGRPKGSKNRFSKAFWQGCDLLWEEGGMEAVRQAMRTQPASYFRSMVIMHKPTLRDLDTQEDAPPPQTPEELYYEIADRYGDDIAIAIFKRDGIMLPKVIESKAVISIEHQPKGRKARPPRLRPKRK